MQIKTKDKIVRAVLRKMDERSIIGQEKYGATMLEEIEGQVKDLDRLYKKLKNKINFLSKPEFSPDKKVKLVFCKSPEGVFIEMVQQLKNWGYLKLIKKL